jgi:uncharacterized membrane protein YhaH (DUF805 family)
MSNLLFSVQGRANRAKFWLVALGIVVVEVILFAVILGGAALSGDPEQIAAAMGPVASVGGLWYLIECGFLRGTPGSNTYGPDPLAAV